MTNLFKKTNVMIASAFMVVVFGLVAAAPANAQMYAPSGYDNAYGYSNPYSQYGCGHPYIYPNGYSSCNPPAVVQQPPVVIQQPPVVVQQPPVIYQQPVIQYQNLNASCYAVSSQIQTGQSVQWVATATGGTGSYSYTWSSTDGLYGSGQTVYFTYANPGTKTATVTVYSNGQTLTVNCSAVNVYQPTTYVQPVTYVQPTYYNQASTYYAYGSSNNNGLDIGCYTDPTTAYVDQPVTWSVEVTGGVGPYTYSWTGSEGLNGGNQSSLIKYYETTGAKNAIVTVTSADGRTGTRACSNTVNIVRHSSGTVTTAPVQAAPAPSQNQLGANAFFSLSNVPWGWVAILVILVLIGTVAYLLFNRPKI